MKLAIYSSCLYDPIIFKLHKGNRVHVCNHRIDIFELYLEGLRQGYRGDYQRKLQLHQFTGANCITVIPHKPGCALGTQDENLTDHSREARASAGPSLAAQLFPF